MPVKNLLLDTNAWLNFLETDPDQELFNAVVRWIEKNEIEVIVPDTLFREWHDKKDKVLGQIRANMRKDLSGIASKSSSISFLAQKSYKRKIKVAEKITGLLQNGKHWPLSQSVKLTVMDRQINHLAPFHNFGNAVGDASLFYSAIEYLQSNSHNEILFVSADADFRAADDYNLHPDLEQPDITIEFHTSIYRAFGHLFKSDETDGDSSTYRSADYVEMYQLLENAEKLPVIRQLIEVYNYVRHQQPFIPTSILCRTFPFKVLDGKRSYSYDYSFGINTNNIPLLEQWHQWNTEVGAEPEIKDDLERICAWLNLNTIFHLTSHDFPHTVAVESKTEATERNVEWKVFALDLAGALQELQTGSKSDIRAIMAHAYYQAFFGNFSASARLYAEAKKHPAAASEEILQFICVYNLKHLERLSSSYHTGIPEDVRAIFRESGSRSLEELALQHGHQNDFDRESIRFLEERTFYTEALDGIVEVSRKIRDQYHSQLKGAWSSNSFIENLLAEFARLEGYLDRNAIIFKQYAQFGELFDYFLEGLLMSNAIKQSQDSHLRDFDDYLLTRLIHYGNADRLFVYLKRYGIKRLKYRAVYPEEEQVHKVILRFWEELPDFYRVAKTNLENNGIFYWDRLERVVSNTLAVLALVDFPATVYANLGRSIVEALNIPEFINRVKPVFLANVIRDKGGFFNGDDLKAMFDLVLKTRGLHEPSLFEAFQALVERDILPGLMSAERQIEMWSDFYTKCPVCDENHHPDILAACIQMLEENERLAAVQKLEEELKHEFNARKYYYYVMYDLVDYAKFFEHYLKSYPDCKEPLKRRTVFGPAEVRYAELNELLNVCFKKNVDTTTADFKRLHGYSPYYDWLLDMDHFDYSGFDPLWVNQYQTSHYFNKIFGNEKCREHIRKYLEKNNHSFLAMLFARYPKG